MDQTTRAYPEDGKNAGAASLRNAPPDNIESILAGSDIKQKPAHDEQPIVVNAEHAEMVRYSGRDWEAK
jgi:hypothetical protein